MAETIDFDADDLFFALVVLRAEVATLMSMIDDLCRHTEFHHPDGLSAYDRFHYRRTVELEQQFLSLEDGNPRLSARLYKLYQEAKEINGYG